jgi:hypothetical protein
VRRAIRPGLEPHAAVGEHAVDVHQEKADALGALEQKRAAVGGVRHEFHLELTLRFFGRCAPSE